MGTRPVSQHLGPLCREWFRDLFHSCCLGPSGPTVRSVHPAVTAPSAISIPCGSSSRLLSVLSAVLVVVLLCFDPSPCWLLDSLPGPFLPALVGFLPRIRRGVFYYRLCDCPLQHINQRAVCAVVRVATLCGHCFSLLGFFHLFVFPFLLQQQTVQTKIAASGPTLLLST